jgi:hypothetical protein
MERMVEVLRLLASPAGVQRQTLPNFVSLTDELALLFDDELRALRAPDRDRPENREVDHALTLLEQRFGDMGDDPTLWTDAALEAAPRWQEVRTIARRLLGHLGVAEGPPKLDWTTYVR